MSKQNTESLVIETLRNHPEGLMINEIAMETGINRITASKYLAVLEAKEIVAMREIGKAKLFTLNEIANETIKETKEGKESDNE